LRTILGRIDSFLGRALIIVNGWNQYPALRGNPSAGIPLRSSGSTSRRDPHGAGDRFSQRTFHWPLSGKPGAFLFGEPLVASELPGEGESHPAAIIAVA
jgi:hypothetical protein